jgi:hypothetical protein
LNIGFYVLPDALVFFGIADDVVVETGLPPERQVQHSGIAGNDGFIPTDECGNRIFSGIAMAVLGRMRGMLGM